MLSPNARIELSQAYQKHGIVLATGAGISAGCVPTWKELLRRIAEQCSPGEGDTLVNNLVAAGLSLPAIASILEGVCRNPGVYSERVRDALYRDFPFFPQGIDPGDPTPFLRLVQTTNQTLVSVASLCACPAETPGMYSANPRVHAIVNLNLDSILRSYVHFRYPNSRVLRTIDRPSAGRVRGAIPVYHVHGFVRFDVDPAERHRHAPDLRVLTEQEYYDFFDQPTSLYTYTFLHLLREYSCLFIGLSMADDNLRRLLHYSNRERIQSYLREGRTSEEGTDRSTRHFAILRTSQPVSTAGADPDLFIQTGLQRLGVRVLWVDSYDQIPSLLAELYDSAGGDWRAVS
jgi:hypothetical protein